MKTEFEALFVKNHMGFHVFVTDVHQNGDREECEVLHPHGAEFLIPIVGEHDAFRFGDIVKFELNILEPKILKRLEKQHT